MVDMGWRAGNAGWQPVVELARSGGQHLDENILARQSSVRPRDPARLKSRGG
ncbi:MAG: hypothetical protein ONB53_18660 [candidate division KSB1 bacterium]|nr:hypothetical protein [candidate division KSB1 bacterium]MDZ7350847.1 hypothetical protein [candidate division KSB1 bacterium]MDZ7355192.1 hypothetical protein [candidate division KSB1 bacterium]MDZ7383808.1 hypothetical protein [candidate division KSB1 bacterium]